MTILHFQRTLTVLVLCSVIPILCLAALVLYQLAVTVNERNDAQNAEKQIHYMLELDRFVQAVQVSRLLDGYHNSGKMERFFESIFTV